MYIPIFVEVGQPIGDDILNDEVLLCMRARGTLINRREAELG